jgi:hypothetical protein
MALVSIGTFLLSKEYFVIEHDFYVGLALAAVLTGLKGVTKRCRLSLLTNSGLVSESQCGGRGGVTGYQPMSTTAHIT